MSQELPPPDALESMAPPSVPPPTNHGRTLAGWFLFWGASLGALIVGIGVILLNVITVTIGAVIIALSLIVSGILRARGRGQPKQPRVSPSVTDPYN